MEQSPIKKTYFDDIFKLRDFITIVFEGFGYFEIAEKVTDKIREISLEKGTPPHPYLMILITKTKKNMLGN